MVDDLYDSELRWCWDIGNKNVLRTRMHHLRRVRHPCPWTGKCDYSYIKATTTTATTTSAFLDDEDDDGDDNNNEHDNNDKKMDLR